MQAGRTNERLCLILSMSVYTHTQVCLGFVWFPSQRFCHSWMTLIRDALSLLLTFKTYIYFFQRQFYRLRLRSTEAALTIY